MIVGIPKISVLIICYKQEKMIRRAIDSLLCQKDYIYEICVSDDCSPDGTWDILCDYKTKYPDLFNIHRNEPNIGIFENIEYSWTMPKGELIYRLAGDDETVDGYFKRVIDFIAAKKIDYKNELVCIYGDYLVKYPNGDSWTGHNEAIAKYPTDALRLGLRGLISNRSCCFSSSIMKKYVKVSQGRSHIAETAQDRQLQLFSKKNYYIPARGNIYYAGIGVSTKISEETFQERMKILPYAESFFEDQGFFLCRKDKYYIKMVQAKNEFVRYRSIGKLMKMILYYCLSRDKSLQYAKLGKQKLVRIISFRIPHSKPIHLN